MSNIDKRALREAAVRAGGVKWQYMRATQHSKAYITDDKGSTVVNCTDSDVPAKCAGFLESANPAAVLALLDELEAAENNLIDSECHVAELEEALRDKQELLEALDNSLCELLPGTQYMDPPDGGSVTPLEQVRRMVADYLNRIAELESRTVTLPEPFKMAKSSSGLTYYYADEVDAAIQAAGIGVKGE